MDRWAIALHSGGKRIGFFVADDRPQTQFLSNAATYPNEDRARKEAEIVSEQWGLRAVAVRVKMSK